MNIDTILMPFQYMGGNLRPAKNYSVAEITNFYHNITGGSFFRISPPSFVTVIAEKQTNLLNCNFCPALSFPDYNMKYLRGLKRIPSENN